MRGVPDVNEFGQPVGDRSCPSGRRGRVRTRSPSRGGTSSSSRSPSTHAAALLGSLCGPEDRSLWTYRATEPPADLDEMTELIARTLATPDLLTFVLVPRGGAPSGIASYTRIDPATGQVEVAGVLYARSLQRTRAATEAIHLLMRYAFEDLGYRRFEWKCDSLNEPSRRAAARLGFTYEGRFRHHMVTKGRNRDTDWYSVTDAEWPAVRAAHERWLDPANFDRGRQRTCAVRVARETVDEMDQRISFLTLAVRDLEASRRFYVDGLGWTPDLEVEGDVIMIMAGERLVLSLWDREHFQAEVGRIAVSGDGVPPFTISHNVATPEEVDAVLATARAAGADPVHDAVEREWGGYTGYFADPDGYRWEIATNPGPIGQKVLP